MEKKTLYIPAIEHRDHMDELFDSINPENSLILRKPTSSSESEGIAGSKILPHGGGVRWLKGSPEYQTILEWILGAKQSDDRCLKPVCFFTFCLQRSQ